MKRRNALVRAVTSRYSRWAVALAVALWLGVLFLYWVGAIGAATAISAGFAVAAFAVTAIVLHGARAFDPPTLDESDDDV